MEAGVIAVGAQVTVIAQPSILGGEREALGQPKRLGESLSLKLLKPIRGAIPAAWRPSEPEDVASGLVRGVAQGQPGVRRLSNAELLGASSA